MQRSLITLAMTLLIATTVAFGVTARANASSSPQPWAKDSGAPTEAKDSGALIQEKDSGVSPTLARDSGAASIHDM